MCQRVFAFIVFILSIFVSPCSLFSLFFSFLFFSFLWRHFWRLLRVLFSVNWADDVIESMGSVVSIRDLRSSELVKCIGIVNEDLVST